MTLSEIETEDKNIACFEKRPIEDTRSWTIQFGGGCSSAEAGEMIVSPKGQLCPSVQLEFTKAEKEVLLLGLKDAEDMGIKLLCVKGNLELIHELVKGYFQVSKHHLRYYRN